MFTRFSSWGALRSAAYRRLWAGAFVTSVGGWIQTISIGVYATQATGKAAWTGLMAAFGYLPSVVLGPVGGALADRMDRRRLLGLLMSMQVVIACTLAALAYAGYLPLGLIGALVFASGCAQAMTMPAFNALLVELVEPGELLSAVSLAAGQFNLARMIGPVLAAGIFAAGGIELAFLANALSYFGVLYALWRTPAPRRPAEPARGGIWKGIADGFRVAGGDPGIRLALVLVLALALLVAPFIGLIPAYAIKVFGRGAGGASFMVTSQGAGALLAALTASAVAAHWGPRRLLTRALFLVAPVAMAYWLAPTWPLALALLAPLGGIYLWTLSSLSATCMGRVSRELQARMNSLYSVTLSGGYAVGLILQGWLADRAGLRLVPALAAGLLWALAFVLWRRGAFAAVDRPPSEQVLLRVRQASRSGDPWLCRTAEAGSSEDGRPLPR